VISTATYEKYTLASRLGPGPLVPNTYTVGERVRFSLRGLFTPEDEWTIALDPRRPNNLYIGYIVQPPRMSNNYYLMLHTAI
jgi:hypothetical protein